MDTIGNFLTIIRNASTAGNAFCSAPYSKVCEQIAKILKTEGYIKDYEVSLNNKNFKSIKVVLKYYNNKAAITTLKRRSTPGCRVYTSCEEIPVVLNGLGCCILTTPKGVLAGRDARIAKVGGEVLCYVW